MGCGGSTNTTADRSQDNSRQSENNKDGAPPHNHFESTRPDDLESIESADNIEPVGTGRKKSGLLRNHNGWLDLERAEAADEAEAEFFVWDDLTVDFGAEARGRALAMKKLREDSEAGSTSTTAKKGTGKKTGVLFNDFIVDDFAEEVKELQRSHNDEDPNDNSARRLTSPAHGTRPQSSHAKAVVSKSQSLVDPLSPHAPSATDFKRATTTTWIAHNPDLPKLVPQFPKKDKSVAKKKFGAAIRWFDMITHVGHPSRVKCLAIAPGEKEYVSCSSEDTIVTYGDIRTGQELGQFNGHRETVISATFSYCGKYLATTSRDNTLMLWDIVTQKAVFTFEHAKVVICCCFSRDSRYVGTGCQDKVCRVWDTRKGREVLTFLQHEGIIISMAFSPDGKNIVSASSDKTLRVWSTSNGRARATLTGHQAIILSCSFTNDGKRIISNDEKAIKVWSADSAQNLMTIAVDDFVKVRNLPPNRKLTWTLTAPAPGKFSNYIVAACNNRFVFFIDIGEPSAATPNNKKLSDEPLSVYCKAPVYCLAPGEGHGIGCGDSFGNLYFVTVGETQADTAADPTSKFDSEEEDTDDDE